MPRFPRVRKSKNGTSSHLNYESFEPRQLLAAFSATDGNDNVVINFVNDQPASIVINGTTLSNPDPTISISMGLGEDRLTFSGATFNVTSSAAPPSLVVESDIPITNLNGTGSANGVADFEFKGRITIVTGDGDDSFDVVMPRMQSYSGVPDGQPYRDVLYFSVETGGGDDVFRFEGMMREVHLGAGLDRVIEVNEAMNVDRFAYSNPVFFGDDGLDSFYFEKSGVIHKPEFYDGEWHTQDTKGFERFYAPVITSANKDILRRVNFVGETYVEGNHAVLVDDGAFLELYNFSTFAGADYLSVPYYKPIAEGFISVASIASDLNLVDFKKVVLGGDVNYGQAYVFQHKIKVNDCKELVVSSSVNPDGMNVWIEKLFPTVSESRVYLLKGLTPIPVEFTTGIPGAPFHDIQLTLMGSNTGNDIFSVPESFEQAAGSPVNAINLYGNGGDDLFIIGSAVGGGLKDLNRMRGHVAVVGGSGNDRIWIDDSQSTGRYSYRLRDNWIHNAPDPAGDPNRTFSGVWNTGVEIVSLQATSQSNRFRVTVSKNTRFVINANAPSTAPGDRLLFINYVPPTRKFTATGVRKGFWSFGQNGSNEYQSVFLTDIEHNAV